MPHSFAAGAIAALVVAAVSIESGSGNDDNESFASALHRVIRASRENFRPVEGARIELHPGNKSYFQARVDLPGTTECRIDEPPNVTYSCKWKPQQSQAAGSAPCDKLLADLQAALGAEWSRTDSPKLQTRKTTFRTGGRYRTTEVTVTPPTRLTPGCTIAISILQAADSRLE
jgi:hypothetical protein